MDSSWPTSHFIFSLKVHPYDPQSSQTVTHLCSCCLWIICFVSCTGIVPETKEVVIHKYKTPMVSPQYFCQSQYFFITACRVLVSVRSRNVPHKIWFICKHDADTTVEVSSPGKRMLLIPGIIMSRVIRSQVGSSKYVSSAFRVHVNTYIAQFAKNKCLVLCCCCSQHAGTKEHVFFHKK